TFNGAIDLGGGLFNLRQGQATINSPLIASNVLVANQGLFANNSQITASVANAGTLINNGSILGDLANSGTLTGNGTIVGNLANGGLLSPGNSLGTITVTGNAALAPSTSYNVEVNNPGRSDTIAVSGATAIQGGTVAAVAQPGVYAPRTTYTILSSAG